MKKAMIFILVFFTIITISSCRTIYRDYQDDELETMTITQFNFDTFEIFKIIDVDTARYLTTKDYQNSGIVIGIKNDEYKMIFIPRKVSEEPYVLQNTTDFNLEEIYLELENFVEETFFLEDYGGLSVSVEPYEAILEKNSSLNFDSQIFFIVTTDEEIFYSNYINGSLVIFDKEYNLIFSQT